MQPETNETKHGIKELNKIIRKRENVKTPQIIYDLEITTQNMTDEPLLYLTFQVETTGIYSLTNQLCLTAIEKTKFNTLQYGICSSTFTDSNKIFNSLIISADVERDMHLSYNLMSLCNLEANKEYVLWCSIDSSNNENFRINGELSRFYLLKL